MSSQDHSAFWIFAIIFGIVPIAGMIATVLVQRFKTQERLRAMEKGLPLPPEKSSPLAPTWTSPRQSPQELEANFRAAGIICVAVGLGLLVLFTSLAETLPTFPKGVIGVSAIPFFIGVGFLVEYRMRRSASR